MFLEVEHKEYRRLHVPTVHYCFWPSSESKAESRYLLNSVLPWVNWSDIECDLSVCLMTTGYMVNELEFCGQPSSPGINYKSCPAWGHCSSSAEMAFWAIASRKVMSLTLPFYNQVDNFFEKGMKCNLHMEMSSDSNVEEMLKFTNNLHGIRSVLAFCMLI